MQASWDALETDRPIATVSPLPPDAIYLYRFKDSNSDEIARTFNSPFLQAFFKVPPMLIVWFSFRKEFKESKNGGKHGCVTIRYQWPIDTKFGGYRVDEMVDLKYKILDSGRSWRQLKICYRRNEEIQILYNEEQRSRRIEFGTFRKRSAELSTISENVTSRDNDAWKLQSEIREPKEETKIGGSKNFTKKLRIEVIESISR